MKEYLKENAYQYDCLFFYHIRSSQYLPKNFTGKTIIEIGDLYSENYLQTFNYLNILNPLKYIYLLESILVKKTETKIFSNFDKVTYKFPLGTVDQFKNYRTISFKILASKEDNGEVIAWVDNKKVFEVYGPNFTIGNGYTFKWGFYRWLKDSFLNETPTQSLTVKEFGFSDKCEEILDQNKSNVLESKVKLVENASIFNKFGYMFNYFFSFIIILLFIARALWKKLKN